MKLNSQTLSLEKADAIELDNSVIGHTAVLRFGYTSIYFHSKEQFVRFVRLIQDEWSNTLEAWEAKLEEEQAQIQEMIDEIERA